MKSVQLIAAALIAGPIAAPLAVAQGPAAPPFARPAAAPSFALPYMQQAIQQAIQPPIIVDVDAAEIAPPEVVQYVPGLGFVRRGAPLQSQAADAAINAAVQAYKDAKNDEPRAAALAEIRKRVGTQFAARQADRDRELADLEGRVTRLRDIQKQRQDQRERIIEDRVQLLVRDAAGLGWGDAAPAAGAEGMPAPLAYPAYPSTGWAHPARAPYDPSSTPWDDDIKQLIREGKFGEAEPLLKHQLAFREKTFGPDNLWAISALVEIADAYCSQEKYLEAEPYCTRAVAVCQKIGAPDEWMITSLLRLAQAYRGQGKHADAEPLGKQAVAICEKIGSQDERMAASLVALAHTYVYLEKFVDAEPLGKRAVAICEKIGFQDERMAASLVALARAYAGQEQFADAEPLFLQALAIFEKGQVDAGIIKKVRSELEALRKRQTESRQGGDQKADGPAPATERTPR
ncbi:MAG: tetratricopeptide repeat protein [Planctomycetia bacterium]|jgi:tetratricopeptide (TPR) repeat protein